MRKAKTTPKPSSSKLVTYSLITIAFLGFAFILFQSPGDTVPPGYIKKSSQCSDTKDNDNDGKIDFGTATTNDNGCSSATDITETGTIVCDNGIDETNDADTKADFRLSGGDPGCINITDTSEVDGQCDDFRDNDGDKAIDYPKDTGCISYSDRSERGTLQCDDGLDNDVDGKIDYQADLGCSSSSDNNETNAQQYPQSASINGEPIGKWWNEIVNTCAEKWAIKDPYFIAAIVKKESWFNASVYNKAEKEAYERGEDTWYGEYYGKGLMQITGPWIAGVPKPSTFEWEYNMPPEAKWEDAPTLTNAYNGTQNLDRGCWYMKSLLQHYSKDQYKMASAYRYGWQGVDAKETDPYNNEYVTDVFRYKKEYLDNVGLTEGQFPNK